MNNVPIKVGGLDCSLSNFGMSKGTLINNVLSIEDISLCTTEPNKDTRYKNIDDLDRAIKLKEAMFSFFFDVDIIYVELPIGSQSARAMASYGITLGVVASLGNRVVRVSPKDVKMYATNNPKATKADMINWATDKYPDLPWLTRMSKGIKTFTNANEHVADSLAAMNVGINNANK